MAELHRLQAERKAALEVAVAEAALLAQFTESTGKSCDTSEPFTRRNFGFSAFEMASTIDRHLRLEEAKKFVAAKRKPLRLVKVA